MDMHEIEYLIVDAAACKENEKGTCGKSDANEIMTDNNLPLHRKMNEPKEVDNETLPYVTEGWNEPKQVEVDKGLEPDFPLLMETRQRKRTVLSVDQIQKRSLSGKWNKHMNMSKRT